MTTAQILNNAKNAKNEIRKLTSEQKNKAIDLMAKSLILNTDKILAANKIDVDNSTGIISDVMIDRLRLDENRIKGMADGLLAVKALKDPYNSVISETKRDNGLVIKKVLSPMGVIAIIYESRPNVTSDAAVLCFKSSNVCVLRSGKEAYGTSKAVVEALREGLQNAGITPFAINLIDDTTRQSSIDLMTANGYVDLLIPRGGKGLIKACVENATVPCIETGTGICHIYVEKSADIGMALEIINNAKTSRPSVCNAAEVLLVDEEIAEKFLPLVKNKLCENRENPVELILCEKSAKIIDGTKANEDSFDTEFLDYKLAVKVVKNTEEAVDHILNHSTGHSEAIITNNSVAADYFKLYTDSAAVYVNASTRFTDGGEFGLGCEMGISTQKLHARGPMGLSELMTYKYVIEGEGQIR